MLAGYARLGQSIPLDSHQHVLELKGLAVDPAHHRRGVGRALVEGVLRAEFLLDDLLMARAL